MTPTSGETLRTRYLADGIVRFITGLVTRCETAERESATWKESAESLLAENSELRTRLSHFTMETFPVIRTERSLSSPGSPIHALPCKTDTAQ